MSGFKFNIGEIVQYSGSCGKVLGIIREHIIREEMDPLYYIERIAGRLNHKNPHNCNGHVPNGNGYQFSESELTLVHIKMPITSKQINRLQTIFGNKIIYVRRKACQK